MEQATVTAEVTEEYLEAPGGYRVPLMWVLSSAAAYWSRRAVTGGRRPGAGRKPKIQACPRGCGWQGGTVELRKHRCGVVRIPSKVEITGEHFIRTSAATADWADIMAATGVRRG